MKTARSDVECLDPVDQGFDEEFGLLAVHRVTDVGKRSVGDVHMTLGIVTMTDDAPHRGEVHPDGDEILYVISGRVRVAGESEPDSALVLGAGEACIVTKGEWHLVKLLEPTQLIHITPGPNGDHRPL